MARCNARTSPRHGVRDLLGNDFDQAVGDGEFVHFSFGFQDSVSSSRSTIASCPPLQVGAKIQVRGVADSPIGQLAQVLGKRFRKRKKEAQRFLDVGIFGGTQRGPHSPNWLNRLGGDFAIGLRALLAEVAQHGDHVSIHHS